MHEPEIEKYKELIDTPFDGDTIEDFGKYLFDNIINISGNYHSSLDDLVEELYDFGLDDEADKLDEIHRMIEDHLEDSFSQISVRIYGCIDNENNIFNYPADGEKNKLNPELMFLKSEEWSFSVIKKLFRESSGNDSFDILNDNWELTWIETGLYNLDDCKNVGNKTYFIVCYVKKFRDSREALSKQLLSSENSEGETRQEEIPLNIAFEKEREYNDSAWENLEAPSTQSTLQFCLGQLTWGSCPPEINISSITQYSNTTIDVSYYIEPNNNEVDEVVLLYSLEC